MLQSIGIDFGTTNSVVALLHDDGTVTTAQHAAGAATVDVYRSVLCFWDEEARGRRTLHHASGPAAIESWLEDPLDNRLIMSMKTYLAQRSFSETRIFGHVFTLERLISQFLRDLLAATGNGAGCRDGSDRGSGSGNGSGAGPSTGSGSGNGSGAGPGTGSGHGSVAGTGAGCGPRIVVGRPVRFAGEFADDALGATRLRGAYAAAGLPQVTVALEPEAAGSRFARTLTRPATVLIGDFGGGTSDFSVLRFQPGVPPRVTPLGHAGIGIAGDVFDYRIIDHAVSPLLGKGDTYRVLDNWLPVPAEYYGGFARWHLLSLMRTPRTLRSIREVARTARHPERLHQLVALIEDGVGYALYQAVSGAKAALSRADSVELRFSHGSFAVARSIARDEFESWIAADLARLGATVDQALAAAGVPAQAIDHVFLTGGTAFVPAVRRLFTARFGEDRVAGGGEFVSVAEGLALMGTIPSAA